MLVGARQDFGVSQQPPGAVLHIGPGPAVGQCAGIGDGESGGALGVAVGRRRPQHLRGCVLGVLASQHLREPGQHNTVRTLCRGHRRRQVEVGFYGSVDEPGHAEDTVDDSFRYPSFHFVPQHRPGLSMCRYADQNSLAPPLCRLGGIGDFAQGTQPPGHKGSQFCRLLEAAHRHVVGQI